MKRQLHLNLFIHSRGHHEASWRHPASSPLALTDIRYYQDLARRAESAKFDSIFIADQLALAEDVAQRRVFGSNPSPPLPPWRWRPAGSA
jgi:alkanesulfonate monooxygenase SsuD/methylene tetrahydromethanopterin reductase-like flavin-dependent oxidoreductase (luciferase family)